MKPLRKCRICGLEAFTQGNLEKFRKDKRKRYGRGYVCKACYNALCAKGGKYWSTKKLSDKRSNLKKHPKRMNFQGRRIIFKKNPRKNVCLICGRMFPSELKRQTSLHHFKYDEERPLKYTTELCNKCHVTFHHTLRKYEEKVGRTLNLNEKIDFCYLFKARLSQRTLNLEVP